MQRNLRVRGRVLAALLVAALVLAHAGRALADPPVVHRPVPSYDGRAPRAPSVGESLLWIPRVVLAPLYALTEFVVRRPLGWLLTNAERTHLIQRTERLVAAHRGIFAAPTLAFDLGLVSSGGIYFAWNRAGTPDNFIRLHASTGGPGYWFFYATDRYRFAPRSFVGVQGSYYERADWRYYGLGSNTFQRDEQRFDWGRADVGLYVQHRALEHAGLDVASGVRWDRFGTPRLSLPPQLPTPPGYEDKAAYYGRGALFLDSRPYDRPTTSGVRLDLGGEYAADLSHERDRRWITYSASGSIFIEVMRPGRVIGISVYAAMADPLTSEPIPFVDLITLGGFEYMRGWWVGRFRGESATVATLSYRYPIWYWLDGNVYVEAGNTFAHHFEDFDITHLFGSAGFGFRTVGSRDSSFDILIAAGSSRFDAPTFAIDSVRVALGINRGF